MPPPSIAVLSRATLAQTTLAPRAWLYFGLLILLALVGGLIIFAVRRRVLDDRDDSNAPNSGLMASLDEMRRKGEITQHEYDQTKRRIVEKTLENIERDKAKRQEQERSPDRTT